MKRSSGLQVDRRSLVETASAMVDIPSPTGSEQAMAEHIAGLFHDMGLQVQWQEVEDGRPNVIGTWRGAGGGKTLMFNGHMDTSYSGHEPWLAGSPRFPARGACRGGLPVRSRDLEHEGRARLLRRSRSRTPGGGRTAEGRRADRRGRRRDRKDAVGRGVPRQGVPRLRSRVAPPGLARRRRRHVRARRADRAADRARALRLDLDAAHDTRPVRAHRIQRRPLGGELDPAHARTSSTRCRSGSPTGRRAPRTATSPEWSTSGRSAAASPGGCRGRRSAPSSSSTCVCPRRCRWRRRAPRSATGCARCRSASPTSGSTGRSTCRRPAPRSRRVTSSSRAIDESHAEVYGSAARARHGALVLRRERPHPLRDPDRELRHVQRTARRRAARTWRSAGWSTRPACMR